MTCRPIIHFLPLILCLLLLNSCGSKGAEASAPPVEITRLDRQLAAGSFDDSLSRSAAETLFALSGYGQLDSAKLALYQQHPSITAHIPAVQSSFADLTEVSASLGALKSNLASSLPKIRFPHIYAIISPFNQSVILSDSLLYLGLNHYLGIDYEPYGYFPDYIVRRKIRERILPDISEALIRNAYPFAADSLPADQTLPSVLQHMLYEGAVLEAVMQTSSLSEREALGLTEQEYKWLEENERNIWQTLIERKYLFSTDPSLIRSLTSLTGSTPAIHPNAPGLVGRFIGHRITRAYLKQNPDTPLSALLSPSYYLSPETLQKASY